MWTFQSHRCWHFQIWFRVGSREDIRLLGWNNITSQSLAIFHRILPIPWKIIIYSVDTSNIISTQAGDNKLPITYGVINTTIIYDKRLWNGRSLRKRTDYGLCYTSSSLWIIYYRDSCFTFKLLASSENGAYQFRYFKWSRLSTEGCGFMILAEVSLNSTLVRFLTFTSFRKEFTFSTVNGSNGTMYCNFTLITSARSLVSRKQYKN